MTTSVLCFAPGIDAQVKNSPSTVDNGADGRYYGAPKECASIPQLQTSQAQERERWHRF